MPSPSVDRKYWYPEQVLNIFIWMEISGNPKLESFWHVDNAYNSICSFESMVPLGVIWLGMGGPSNVHLSIFITTLNLYKTSEIEFVMLMWGWNMHHSQKTWILALDSKYLGYLCLLYGMDEWNETAWGTQVKIPNYFDGREGEREEGKIKISLCIILSVMVFKGWNRCTEPQSCPLFSATTMILRKSSALLRIRKKNLNHHNKIFPFPARTGDFTATQLPETVFESWVQLLTGSLWVISCYLCTSYVSGLSLESCWKCKFSLHVFM